MKFSKILVTALGMAALSACGGGGSEANKDTEVPALEAANGPVYAEMADGRFQPLKQVQGNRDTPPGTDSRDDAQ